MCVYANRYEFNYLISISVILFVNKMRKRIQPCKRIHIYLANVNNFSFLNQTNENKRSIFPHFHTMV